MRLLGILVSGLRDDSRLVQKASGVKTNDTELLMASILDGVNFLVWAKTKDAEKGRNRPKSVVEKLIIKEKEKDPDIMTFATAEEFDRAMERFNRENQDV